MYTARQRVEAKAQAETIQLDEGDSLEGIVMDVDYVDNLGGYKGRTPILYLDTESGPAKFFAMHLTAKSGVVSARPQGGDTIVIARGPDGGEKPNQYRSYFVAVERADKSERFRVFDWENTPVLSGVESEEATRLDQSGGEPEDDLPF